MARTTLLSLAVAALLWHGSALADSVTLTLSRTSLITTDDSFGTAQHLVGLIKNGNKTVGNFYFLLRNDTAVPLNDAIAQVYLIFPSVTGSAVPENLVLEGVYDYDNGKFKGSVSATSDNYKWARESTATFSPIPNTNPSALNLVIRGSFSGVTLP